MYEAATCMPWLMQELLAPSTAGAAEAQLGFQLIQVFLSPADLIQVGGRLLGLATQRPRCVCSGLLDHPPGPLANALESSLRVLTSPHPLPLTKAWSRAAPMGPARARPLFIYLFII